MAHAEPAEPDSAVALIPVELVYAAAPHQLVRVPLLLPVGSTVGQAWLASGLEQRFGARLSSPAPDGLTLGLWGRLCPPDTVLQAHDRLELLRALVVDPMEARRQRQRRDGVRKQARRTSPKRGPKQGTKPAPQP